MRSEGSLGISKNRHLFKRNHAPGACECLVSRERMDGHLDHPQSLDRSCSKSSCECGIKMYSFTEILFPNPVLMSRFLMGVVSYQWIDFDPSLGYSIMSIGNCVVLIVN